MPYIIILIVVYYIYKRFVQVSKAKPGQRPAHPAPAAAPEVFEPTFWQLEYAGAPDANRWTPSVGPGQSKWPEDAEICEEESSLESLEGHSHYQFDATPLAEPKSAKPARANARISAEQVRRAFIVSEIIAPPRARRRRAC